MANEVIRIHDQFYILSTSGRIDDRTRVLKHGDMFAVFDRFGDIERFGSSELGLSATSSDSVPPSSASIIRTPGSCPVSPCGWRINAHPC